MIEQLIDWDKKLFLAINELHAQALDPIMLYATQTKIWLPLYLVVLYFIITDFKKDSWAPLLGILLTILLADQVTSSVMKPFFQRLRPTHDPSIQQLVHIVNGYTGGKFGFASSHAANTFGLATFLWLLFGSRRKWFMLFFIWAFLMSYSRIYLGVHFPGDIIVGALVGVASAFAGFKLSMWLQKISNKRNQLPQTH